MMVVVMSAATVVIVVMVDVTSGHEHDWGSFNPVYKNVINETTKALETRANVAGAVFTAGTETDITLTPTLYYDNAQASPKSAHITAVVPSGTIESSKVVFGKVDGLQDVMTIGAGSRCRNCSVTKSKWM